jgi:aspartyl-tRNA(Asn)/glutamyl-tRNA(Gln) amidotransferase subunit C
MLKGEIIMSVSKEDVLHIANLSKLYVSDEKLEKYTRDLSNVVDLANSLSEVDIDNVKVTNHILDIKNVFRKDEVEPSYKREEILKNAPDSQGGCVSVPKVVE